MTLNNPDYAGEPLELARYSYSASECTVRFWLNESHREELGDRLAHVLTITFTRPEFEESQFADFTHDWCFVTQSSPNLIEINSNTFEARSVVLQWHDFDIDDYRQLLKEQKIQLGKAKQAQIDANLKLASIRKFVKDQKIRRERTHGSSQPHARDQKIIEVLNRIHELAE